MDFSMPDVKRDAPSVFPRFYVKAVENAFQSQKEGRPIFDNVEYVEITVAGDTRTTVDRRVKAEDKERWADTYRRFSEGQEQAASGTPLEEWPALTPSMIAEMKAAKIFSVDALATLDDGHLGQLGTGGRQIRDKAKAWLERAASDAPLSSALREAEDLKAQLVVKDKTIDDLSAEVERLKTKLVERV